MLQRFHDFTPLPRLILVAIMDRRYLKNHIEPAACTTGQSKIHEMAVFQTNFRSVLFLRVARSACRLVDVRPQAKEDMP